MATDHHKAANVCRLLRVNGFCSMLFDGQSGNLIFKDVCQSQPIGVFKRKQTLLNERVNSLW
jgi:hypothetical protein